MLPSEIAMHAEAFRNAIESAIRSAGASALGIGFSSFPNGACGDASLALAVYLASKGVPHITYHNGIRYSPDFHSHAWLEADGLFVDITGDQFGDDRPPVFVGRDSGWFAQWMQDRLALPFDSPEFQNYAAPSLRGYAHILLAIPRKT